MSEYLAEKYAELLTKGDAMELFKLIENRFGTIKDACEAVGIERKTFYDWKKAVKEIKVKTKKKLLKFLLEEHPIDTLEFLTDRSAQRTIELLKLTLSTIYEHAIVSDREEFKRLSLKFANILRKYDEPLTHHIDVEISDMVMGFLRKSEELNISIEKPSVPLLLRATPDQEIFPVEDRYLGITIPPQEPLRELEDPFTAVMTSGTAYPLTIRAEER